MFKQVHVELEEAEIGPVGAVDGRYPAILQTKLSQVVIQMYATQAAKVGLEQIPRLEYMALAQVLGRDLAFGDERVDVQQVFDTGDPLPQ